MAAQGPRLPVILLVSDEYGTFKGGVSTINCQASQTLQGKAVVYCTVLRVSEQDQEAANRDGVTLIRPDPLGLKYEPTLDWLTYYHHQHFPNLPPYVTCIIGHADITDTAARNIKDQRYPQADLMMFTHVLPEDTEYYKGGRKAMNAWEKDNDMLDKVDNAKAAFSVGRRIFNHFQNRYRGMKKPQNHHIFLPKPSELFLATDVSPGGGQKVVLSIGRVRNVEKLKGHDLVGESMREVVKVIKNARLRVRGISEDDFETSQKILADALNSPDLNPTLLPYGTQEDIRDDMMMAHLVLMPSRSEPFGLVGLEAIAAGIPVLISDKTGLADMITDLIRQEKLSAEHRNAIVETSVNDRDRAGDVKRWADRIVDVLQHSDSEFEKAARFKQELLESRYWKESHNAFLQACGITDAGEGYDSGLSTPKEGIISRQPVMKPSAARDKAGPSGIRMDSGILVTDEDFQPILGRISGRLDETDVRKLVRVWSARTGQQDSAGIERPQDLMRAMVKSGRITTGDFGMLEKDMMATGISFPVIVRDIPEVPDELRDLRTSEAPVGPKGGKAEIPGFVKLVVPKDVLQRETKITVSTVDIPGILRGDEGVSWTSGYPWSLGEDACPRELLDQVLFSPAVDINLHGARLSGPLELETWRPPGSEGMECVILKHHDGQGWTDITATTLHHIGSDKLSVFLSNFSALGFVWTKVKAVANDMLDALLSRTLDCRFAGYIKPHEEGVEFHVVCRDQSVETDEEEYLPDFTKCRTNDAEFYLYHDDRIEVAVAVDEGKGPTKKVLGRIRADHCRRAIGQSFQTRLKRSSGKPVNGVVVVTKFQDQVCQFSFWEKEFVVPSPPPDHEGPVVLMLNDEYGTAKGGISTIHRQMGRYLVSKGAKVYSTVLEAKPKDKDDAKADKVTLIFPTTFEGDPTKHGLGWLTWEHRSRYPDLPSHVDFIVGHVHITSRAARLIKKGRLRHDAKLVQVTHVIPEDVARHKSEEEELRIKEERSIIRKDLKDADVIVSVGPRLFDYYQKETGGKTRHEVFLPEPSDIFKNAEVKYVDTKTKVVLSIGRVKGVERLKGYDLTAKTMVKVMEQLPNTIWRVCGISPDDFSESKAIIEANMKKGKIQFTPLAYGTQEELCEEMEKADVVLMPSRAEPFGLVGLEAIAAGVPVLVSHKSGLAWFLKTQDPEFDRTIVEIEEDDDKAAETLYKRVIKILTAKGAREFEAAQSLRKKLLESNYWADSHAKFQKIFGL